MSPVLVELNPNRLLLDSNFDGYKLSLQEIPNRKLEHTKPIDRILLTSSQYTLLHAKIYGLHNHLIGDPFDDNGSVYFIDTDWNICKTYLDPFTDEFVQPITIWQIPKNNTRKIGDYNVTLRFVNKDLAVVADGTGFMYILNTDSRNDDNIFTSVFSDMVIGQNEGFLIVDTVCRLVESQKELHILLMNIKQDDLDERFFTILHWISFSMTSDRSWQQEAIRQLKVSGNIQYAALERDCAAIYVVSDSGCKFTLNSDYPLVTESKTTENKKTETKPYQWKQSGNNIILKFTLENLNKDIIDVESHPTKIKIKYNGMDLLCGDLYQRINSETTTWTIEKDYLEVIINKSESGLMWSEVVKGDQAGEYTADPNLVQGVHERLSHLCDDSEDSYGTTFNSQQVEECDFENDKSIIFERLHGRTNGVTHKIHLGSHQVLLTANLNRDLSPALGIRHDVDLCLWQPQGIGDDFSITHEGTLLAFGYVQASKQNRKFSCCPPDLSYSVICESSRHLFIYRQNKPVMSGELRNRSTGRRVHTTAQQQVINLPEEEIIGIYATNSILFLLCENSILALKV
ncbi:hypothetical protein NQ317_014174 [Molorchus minor]|uniref:NudC domain-containing protein 1 n=1 Tax=Molorchus minor TaxID=1323400 RepID=A0ABQ9JJM3_9CUCU|nr:hypothetical protein NQ317_014174 [Molorchus minor]